MDQDIQSIVESLMTSRNSLEKRIITGFNFFHEIIEIGDYAVITFSNIHSEPLYFFQMMKDMGQMGYPNDEVTIQKRDKNGYYKWESNFIFRHDGTLLKGLKIKDIESNKFLKLEEIPFNTLKAARYSKKDVQRGYR